MDVAGLLDSSCSRSCGAPLIEVVGLSLAEVTELPGRSHRFPWKMLKDSRYNSWVSLEEVAGFPNKSHGLSLEEVAGLPGRSRGSPR